MVCSPFGVLQKVHCWYLSLEMVSSLMWWYCSPCVYLCLLLKGIFDSLIHSTVMAIMSLIFLLCWEIQLELGDQDENILCGTGIHCRTLLAEPRPLPWVWTTTTWPLLGPVLGEQHHISRNGYCFLLNVWKRFPTVACGSIQEIVFAVEFFSIWLCFTNINYRKKNVTQSF